MKRSPPILSVLAISLTLLDIAVCSRNKSLSGIKTVFENKIHMPDLTCTEKSQQILIPLWKKYLSITRFTTSKDTGNGTMDTGKCTIGMLLKATGLLCYFLISLKEETFLTGNIQKRKKWRNHDESCVILSTGWQEKKPYRASFSHKFFFTFIPRSDVYSMAFATSHD